MSARRMTTACALAATVLASAAEAQTKTDRQRAAEAKAAGWRAALPRKTIDKFPGGEVQSVDFLTRHIGWAVGHGQATMILRTTDGGRSWERVPLFDGEQHGRSFEAVRFWDANHGWILGFGELLRTTNGGETWEQVEGTDYIYGTTLLPLSPDVVMVGSKDGRISVTSNDGRKLEQLGRPESKPIRALAFVPPNRFFAVTGENAWNYGNIFASTDGGSTWELVAEGDKPLFDIEFHDERRGIAVGENIAYWTDDGGESWRRAASTGTRYAAAYLDESTIVSVGITPGVTVSRDGGRTWRPFVGPPERYHLVDIDVVDPGWWFVAGGYGVHAVYHFADPDYEDPIARGTVPIPAAIELSDGRTLPAGMYDVTLAHHGEEHVLDLHRTGPAPDDASVAGGEPAGAAADAEIECDPCDAEIPVEVEYELEEVTAETSAQPRFRISLEPTATGVAIVVDAAVAAPRDASIMLAALGTPEEQEIETAVTVRKAEETGRKAGGLLGRLKKAADGNLRGAVADAPVNPKAVSERVKSAKASPPAVYRVRVRHPIEFFGDGTGLHTRKTGGAEPPK